MRVSGLVSRRRLMRCLSSGEIGIVERQVSGVEYEKDDAAGPDVDLSAVVAFLRQDLRSDVPILVEQQVLRLEIAVVDAAGVTVTDGGDELLKVLTAEILTEPPFSHLREQLPAFRELHHEIDLRLGSENFQEAHDMMVAQPAHDRNLPFHVAR
nr:Os05g0514250 [Ipomoea batatas]